jgi:hypothetical protein
MQPQTECPHDPGCHHLQEAIAQLSSSNSTDQDRHDALVAMQMLVEPIDNANGG